MDFIKLFAAKQDDTPDEVIGTELHQKLELFKKASGGETTLSPGLASAGLLLISASIFLPRMDRNLAMFSTVSGLGLAIAGSIVGGSAQKKKEIANELGSVVSDIKLEKMETQIDERLTPVVAGPVEADEIRDYVDSIEREMGEADRAVSNWLQSKIGNSPAVAYYAWQCVADAKKPQWRQQFSSPQDAELVLVQTIQQMTGSVGTLEDLWELLGEDDQRMLRNRPSLMEVCPAVMVSVGGGSGDAEKFGNEAIKDIDTDSIRGFLNGLYEGDSADRPE
jgi:hypothetical protein